jgi:long-chain acyl-CoA synthetase
VSPLPFQPSSLFTPTPPFCFPSQGDTLKIIEDLCALRPTIFVSVPRLFNRIYDKIIAGASSPIFKAIFKPHTDSTLMAGGGEPRMYERN